MNGKMTIGIIGGTGSMGKWFGDFFSCAGYTVLVSGRKTEITYADIARECEAIILSVPFDAIDAVSKEIGPLLNKNQFLTDLCSLKEKALESMLRNTEAEVAGMHPLFGPFAESIKGQNVILCPGRGERWLKWIENEYVSKGAVVTVMDSSVHDEHMAVVQGLTHFLTICMGRTLQKMNMNKGGALSISTPVFRINYDLIGRLFAQDINLYKSIIKDNKHFNDVFEIFLSSLHEGRNALLYDSDGGIPYLQNIHEFFKESCRQALEESNKFIGALFPDKSE